MVQPCKNFKVCKGYAYDRKAKLCPKCWKEKIFTLNIIKPIKDVVEDKENIYIKFG